MTIRLIFAVALSYGVLDFSVAFADHNRKSCGQLLRAPLPKGASVNVLMNALQDHLNMAREVLYHGKLNRPGEPDFSFAIENLRRAESWANWGADHAWTELRPRRAVELPDGEEKWGYLKRYAGSMRGLAALIQEYRRHFEILQSTPREDRDYRLISDHLMKLEGFANRGHHALR